MFNYSGEAETHKQRWERKGKTPKRAMSVKKETMQENSTKPFISASLSELTPLIRPTSLNTLKNGDRTMLGDLECGGSSRKKKLGLAALTVLIFYEVCGGPFGLEVSRLRGILQTNFDYINSQFGIQDIVRAGGPFYALVGFILLLVWSVPEALITAELSTALPEASGSVGKYQPPTLQYLHA